MLDKNPIYRYIFNLKYGKPRGQLLSNKNKRIYNRILTEEQATSWAEMYYGKWSEDYSRAFGSVFGGNLDSYMLDSCSTNPIATYCGYSGSKLNNYIRGYSEQIFLLYPPFDPARFNDTLTTLLVMAPRIPEDIVVYRYLPEIAIELILKSNKNEPFYIDKSFMSSSLIYDPPNMKDFNHEHVLEIFVDKGTVGVYTNLIPGCGRGECELLILRNSLMYLLDYPYKRNGRTVYPVRLHNNPDSSGYNYFD